MNPDPPRHAASDPRLALLARLAATMDRSGLEALLAAQFEKEGASLKTAAADEILRRSPPEAVIPDAYAPYRRVVRDGVRFMIARFSPKRLARLAADQLLADESLSPEERTVNLARQIPSLHKLGQIIARNRHLDPAFKAWLARLENQVADRDISPEIRAIETDMGAGLAAWGVEIEPRMLAEASVGLVIPFTWKTPDAGESRNGVFKIVKQAARQHLEEELALLDAVARFLDRRRSDYALKRFRFIDVFEDVRRALAHEVRPLTEQKHLAAARRCYAGDGTARVPGLLPFSTAGVTAMERLEGVKITDLRLDADGRRKCARTLLAAVIWSPLFSPRERAVFHGDPHAGNIYAVLDDAGAVSVRLFDWSQAGILSRDQRIRMVQLMTGAFSNDAEQTATATARLSSDRSARGETPDHDILRIVKDVAGRPGYERLSLFEKAFSHIDRAALEGVMFPADLLLFRKSVFTLDGVLNDINPGFDMDEHLLYLMKGVFAEELPSRWIGMMFPHLDAPANYRSLMSNRDVAQLVMKGAADGAKRHFEVLSAMMTPGGFWFPVCRGAAGR